jgi:D-tyrosyl-tRNA(Tyr) deacylase
LAGWKNYQNPYFEDENQVMNLSVKDIDGDMWLVNLHFKPLQKNRPSYIKAAKPDVAIPLYESFVQQLKKRVRKFTQVFWSRYESEPFK